MTNRRLALLLPLLALCAAAPLRASAQTEWSQAEVLALSERLVEELSAAMATTSEAPLQRTAIQQRTRDGAVTQMRRARDDASTLADRLRGGDGHLATEGWFRVVRDRIKLAYETAGNAVPSAAVAPHLDATNEILRELGRYYDAG